MKIALAFVAALTFATTSHAVDYKTSDARCLLYADLAEHIAKQRAEGETEETLIRNAQETQDKIISMSAINIIRFIYTMRVKKSDARQMVYLKCKVGELVM